MGNDGLKNIREDINKIDDRLSCLETKYYTMDKQTSLDKVELSVLITQAVANGNKKTVAIIDSITKEMNKRVSVLENAEANRALENKKHTISLIKTAMITTIIGSMSLGIFTNGISIISEAIKASNERSVETNGND